MLCLFRVLSRSAGVKESNAGVLNTIALSEKVNVNFTHQGPVQIEEMQRGGSAVPNIIV
jgi:hypothetical protein